MPQATDELRSKIIARFGDIGDSGPWQYLQDRDWIEDKWAIKKPNPAHEATEDEWDCVEFLCDEWDWSYE